VLQTRAPSAVPTGWHLCAHLWSPAAGGVLRGAPRRARRLPCRACCRPPWQQGSRLDPGLAQNLLKPPRQKPGIWPGAPGQRPAALLSDGVLRRPEAPGAHAGRRHHRNGVTGAPLSWVSL